jgi:hypothetical protein
MSKFKIKNDEILDKLIESQFGFPKYTTQIINLANQNSGGTRPKVVGQMSELIEEFGGTEHNEWVKWYNERMPGAIDAATEKTWNMICNLKEAIAKIDKSMVNEWVRDLVYNKTFAGLKYQKVIVMKVAEKKGITDYRMATPDEEAQGIDGYIGNTPISIKPITYRTKNMLPESIDVLIIYYDKKKDGIEVQYDI